jgi:hypothetical protein
MNDWAAGFSSWHSTQPLRPAGPRTGRLSTPEPEADGGEETVLGLSALATSRGTGGPGAAEAARTAEKADRPDHLAELP